MHRRNYSQPTHLPTYHTKGHIQNTPTRNQLALKNIIRLVHFLYSSQPRHIRYILANNTPSPEKHPLIQEELGPAITLDGPPAAPVPIEKHGFAKF